MSSRRIGNYQIIDYIGSGGFGSVFKAEDTHTPGRTVAIKELHKKHTRNSSIKQRFFQEAIAMARLDHPNLPRLYTFGEDNGSYYLVMEFLSGRPLTELIHQAGLLDAPRVVKILAQVLEAVSYAHRNGIIHRDLKPDNIFLIDEADRVRVKVLDFGIARIVGGESLTLTGESFGTPNYMSPERITGGQQIDHRTDIYALGIILFEMLTGRAPFQSTATDPALYWSEMRTQHESEPLPDMVPLGVPAELDAIARRAAAKRIEDRYATIDDMLADLQRLDRVATSDVAAAVTARLSLVTLPAAAEVFVDDLSRGISDESNGRIFIDALVPGLHSVRVSKPGYTDYRISVSLEENRQTDLQVALAARETIAMSQIEDTGLVDANTIKMVTVAGEETNSLETIKAPPAPPSAVTRPMTEAVSEPARAGKQLAAVAAAAILLALIVVAYFVLRGPERFEVQAEDLKAQAGEPLETGEPRQTADPVIADAERVASDAEKVILDAEQADELQQKAAEAKRKAEAEVEALKKELQAVEDEKSAADKGAQAGATDRAQPAQGDACVEVLVLSLAGEPLAGVRVGAFSEGNIVGGPTDANGRWSRCGLTPGKTVQVRAMGSKGFEFRQRIVTPGKNEFVISIKPKGSKDGQQNMAEERPRPNRPRPYRRP